MANRLPDQPRPLLEIWQELNRGRSGEPSELLKQIRSTFEGLEKSASVRSTFEELEKFRQAIARLRELRDPLRLAERLIGRSRPLSPTQSTAKRKRGGRPPSIPPEQIEKGIRILRSDGKMTVDAARATLRQAGIKGKDTALYKWVIKPAYSRHVRK
jgi:hypothetical protein